MKYIIAAVVFCFLTTSLFAQNAPKQILLKSNSVYHAPASQYNQSPVYATPKIQSKTVIQKENGSNYVILSSTPTNVKNSSDTYYAPASNNGSDLNYVSDDSYGQNASLTLSNETVMEQVTYKVDGVLRTELVPVSRGKVVKIVDGVPYSE